MSIIFVGLLGRGGGGCQHSFGHFLSRQISVVLDLQNYF